MKSEAPADPFWSGRSRFGPGEAQEPPFPFAFVPGAAGAPSDVARPPGALRPRPLLGIPAGAALSAPLAIDASGEPGGSPKLFLALVRACASLGAALCLSPPQFAARADVVKAAKVPVVLSLPPGETAPSTLAAKADLLLLRLHGPDGANALLEEAALPALVEAARALGGYRVHVCVEASGAALPEGPLLKEAAAAGLSALAISGGGEPLGLPLPALVGAAARVRSAAPKMALAIDVPAPCDGAALAAALAGGAGLGLWRGPVQAAAARGASDGADWKALGDALANALRVAWEDAQRCAARAGRRDPRDLTRDNLRALTYDAAALSGVRLAGYDERLPWWAH